MNSDSDSSIDAIINQEGEEQHAQDAQHGEGSGLRGDGDPRSCRGSYPDIAESDSPRRGQHDLYEHHGQGRDETEETTLGGRLLAVANSAWRSMVKEVDSRWSPIPTEPSRCSSSAASLHSTNLLLGPKRNKPYSNPILQPATMSRPMTQPPTSLRVEQCDEDSRNRSSSTVRRTSKTRRRTSPFCPCFSPNVSDSDSDADGEREGNDDWNLTEKLRSRLAIAGEAANQLPFSFDRGGDVPVHRIVEYSHHLVPDVDKIYAASYYWGVMDRFRAEQLLEGKPEGTFLLRDSAQTEYLFSVSFRRYQRTLHARIEQGNHRFGFDILDPSVFSSATVTALIENYKDPTRCLFFEPQLTHPLHRTTVFSLQELCRGKILSQTTYPKVAQLKLPTNLKQYIREYHYTVPVRTTINPHD